MKNLKLALVLISVCMLSHIEPKAQEIYPNPHKISINKSDTPLSIAGGLNIYDSKNVDQATLNALLKLTTENKKGITTYIATVGSKSAKKLKSLNITLPEKSGAYYLKVDNKQISILGYDDRGTFYAIQTLRQLISDKGEIPMVEITDYPDITFRGTVEGFYGTPWSHHDRISQLEFYGRNKLNTYIYGPKDDPYHSSLSGHATSTNKDAVGGWRVPYPEADAAKIHELVEVAKANKVDFVWAIHPGQDIKWNEEDFNLLINKFEKMYELGVRSFAVFFDDISGDGTNASKQAALLNRIHDEFVAKKSDINQLIICPTEYNKSWSNPSDDGYLPTLGREMYPSIQIMWTGDSVCANITMATLNWINPRIKRPTYIWWNFPVTDYARHILAQGPSYGLDTNATSEDMTGFVSNPMEHAEASKVALFGVADYTWNIADYDFMKSWEAGLKDVLPEASDAYRTFAIHSSDYEKNGHLFRRDESWETKIIDPKNYTKEDFLNLRQEFRHITAVEKEILNSGGNEYLINEMEPWLKQFTKLGERGLKAMRLIKANESGDKAMIWTQLLGLEMSEEQLKSYNANKSGTLKLRPFITEVYEMVLEKLTQDLYGKTPIEPTLSTSLSNQSGLENTQDGNPKTFYQNQRAAEVDAWVAVDMGEVTTINNFLIEQGLKERERGCFLGGTVEYSIDNVEWKEILSFGDNSYIIEYNSIPVEARYIRMVNKVATEEGQRGGFVLRTFKVNATQTDPKIYTNLSQLVNAVVKSEGSTILIQPLLEVVKMESGSYFGIELPMAAQISSVELDLNSKGASVEYSVDSKEWSKEKLAAAKYVRFINDSKKAIELNLRKFEVTTSSQSGGDIVKIMDGDFTTGYGLRKGKEVTVAIPEGSTSVTALCKGKLEINGVKVAKYAEIALESGVSEITITGRGEVRELIFK